MELFADPVPSASSSEAGSCARCSSIAQPFEPFCRKCGLYLLDTQYARIVFEDFKKFLAYYGRGIPRLVIQAFNEYVRWSGTRPVLVISRAAGRRIRFYARLEELLANNAERLFGNVHEEVEGTLVDRGRLAVYYLIDWMLRQASLEAIQRELDAELATPVAGQVSRLCARRQPG